MRVSTGTGPTLVWARCRRGPAHRAEENVRGTAIFVHGLIIQPPYLLFKSQFFGLARPASLSKDVALILVVSGDGMPNSRAVKPAEIGESKTITFLERDIRDAVRLLGLISGVNPWDPSPFHQEMQNRSLAKESSQDQFISRARAVLHTRRIRTKHFNRSMFGEPAWDILLLLYLAESVEARHTVSQLAAAVETPLTTVLRWIGFLEDEQLVERFAHPTDRRVTFVRLTGKGRDAFEAFLNEIPG